MKLFSEIQSGRLPGPTMLLNYHELVCLRPNEVQHSYESNNAFLLRIRSMSNLKLKLFSFVYA